MPLLSQKEEKTQTAIDLPELRRDGTTKIDVDAKEASVNVSRVNSISSVVGTTSTRPLTRTKEQIRSGRIQFAAVCWAIFLAGWNDGSNGPLLPRIREVYQVGYTVVSLLFVLSCIGFITGALLNVPLSEKFGFGKVMVFGATLQIISYSLQAPALPFPAFVVTFFINGVGVSIQDALCNSYVAQITHKAETKMGFLHAAYGAGALSAPLISTQFAQIKHWSFHYLVSLGMAIPNLIALAAVFKFRGQNECLEALGQPPVAREDQSSTFRQIMRHKHVHILAFFILVYVGTEVSIGGWIVTFLIEERGGGPSSGYVSAGFFGGLMFGRVALLWLNRTIGEHRVIFLYILLAIGLELVVWLVPSLIADAVAVAIVGMFLGPIYPITISQTSRILPRWLLTGSIGWISSFGGAGSAVFPFMTGALSSKFGTKSLQPLLVAMMGFMIVLWALVPTKMRKTD